VPSANPLRWVMLQFTDYSASWAGGTILYCKEVGGSCSDESKVDPTMLTVRDPATGLLRRRIKHFSGYSITTGDGDDSRGSFNLGVKGGTIAP